MCMYMCSYVKVSANPVGKPASQYPYDPRSFPLYTSSYTSIAIKFIPPMIIALTMELIIMVHINLQLFIFLVDRLTNFLTNPDHDILWMEEILHHLGCLKPYQ